MNWHCIRLTLQEYESGELEILLSAFRAAFIARNGPRGMALFGTWSDEEMAYLVYATPASERHVRPILSAYSARREEPVRNRHGLSFICGDEEALSLLIC